MLAARLQQARKAKGLVLRDLAAEVGVSATMLSKYERGVATPSSDVLLALASALGVRTEYFFRTAEVTLTKIAHRKRSKLPEKHESRVLAEVREHLERWAALDTVLPAPWSIPPGRTCGWCKAGPPRSSSRPSTGAARDTSLRLSGRAAATWTTSSTASPGR